MTVFASCVVIRPLEQTSWSPPFCDVTLSYKITRPVAGS